jgi:hypothetical protein
VNPAGKTVIATGLALLAVTMFYGVGYAVFDEHQTLVGMGESMAAGFLEAAAENLPAAFESLDAYGALSQEYRNEVHAHGHWGMLSLILIVLGLVFGRIAFSEQQRRAVPTRRPAAKRTCRRSGQSAFTAGLGGNDSGAVGGCVRAAEACQLKTLTPFIGAKP